MRELGALSKQREGSRADDDLDEVVARHARAPGKSTTADPDDDPARLDGEPGKRTRANTATPGEVMAASAGPGARDAGGAVGKESGAGELGLAFGFLAAPGASALAAAPVLRHTTSVDQGTPLRREELEALLAGSAGAPLPDALRLQLQRRLGDLDDVRIHTGDAADRAARLLHADAFAVGRDVYFAAGKYDPTSAAGQRLIAHEVAHTAQRISARGGGALDVSSPGDAHEQEADAFAEAFAQAILPTARPPAPAAARPELATPAAATPAPAAPTLAAAGPAFPGPAAGGAPDVVSRTPAAGAAPAATPAAAPTQAGATKPAEQKPFSRDMLKTAVGKVNQAGDITATMARLVGDQVWITSPGVSMNGTVTLKPDADPSDKVEAGWVQTVQSSSRIGLYYLDTQLQHRDITAFSSTRDGKRGAPDPWYVPPDEVSKAHPLVYPQAEDQPKFSLPATLRGAKLQEVQGADKFTVSLKVGVGQNLETIESFAWEAPYGVTLDTNQRGDGSEVKVARTDRHDGPKNKGVANEVGNSDAAKVQTYETEAAATAALGRMGIHGFIREMPKHKQMAPESYWNMVTALWKSSAKFTLKITAIGSKTSMRVALKADKTFDFGEVKGDGTYSALAHMVYDPAAIGPNHSVLIMINGMSQGHITWPYKSASFKDAQHDEYVFNLDISLG